MGLALVLVGPVLWKQRFQVHLRRKLVERGVPVCLACGYDLRGVDLRVGEARCAECGRRFNPAVLTTRKGAFLYVDYRPPGQEGS